MDINNDLKIFDRSFRITLDYIKNEDESWNIKIEKPEEMNVNDLYKVFSLVIHNLKTNTTKE